MDLEKLNGEYLKLKQDIEIKKGVIVAYEHRVQDLTLDKIIWTGKKAEARKNSDHDAEKTAQDELNKIDEEIKQLQESVEQEKETIKEFQGKIDAKITEIKENPEMKKHLDTVLKKKYERKLAKVEKEKAELIDKKDKVEQIKQLTTEHPALANNLKGMISAYKTAENLKKELKSQNILREMELLHILILQEQMKLKQICCQMLNLKWKQIKHILWIIFKKIN